MVHRPAYPDDNTAQMQVKIRMHGMGEMGEIEEMGENGEKMSGKHKAGSEMAYARDNLRLPVAIEIETCETTREIEKGEVVEQCKSHCSRRVCITLISR